MTERRPDYDQFEASELYCATCKQATPVRKRLLMVLPTGNRYDATRPLIYQNCLTGQTRKMHFGFKAVSKPAHSILIQRITFCNRKVTPDDRP